MSCSKRILLLIVGVMLISFINFNFIYGQLRIMPLGDSITEGKFSADNGGYREDLQSFLDSNNIPYDFVGSLKTGSFPDNQHEGHDGFKAAQIDSGIYGWLSNNNPDFVLLHIGTNDVEDSVANNTLFENLESIINKIHNYNNSVFILLSSIIPRNQIQLDSLITEANKSIKILYEKKKEAGYQIYYVGNNEAFKSNSAWASAYIGSDMIHPTETGYTLMAETFFHTIINIYYGGEVTDNFNRKTLGGLWAINNDFDIKYSAPDGELRNIATDQTWGHVAVYKGASDPGAVSFTWSNTADADGILNGGLAVLLRDPGPSTYGYMVRFKKENDDKTLNLWTIRNGTTGVMVDEKPNLLGTPPIAGNQCKVVLSTDANSHTFDCYINGNYAGTLRDPDRVYGNSTNLYSGVMLRGGSNNNIDNFDLFLIGDTTKPATITDLSVMITTSSSINLKWTAPGDDAMENRASIYEIRYSEKPINNETWKDATLISGAPAPSDPGVEDFVVVAGLTPGVKYYFAIKTADDRYNWSDLSNILQASISTGGGTLEKIDTFDKPSTLIEWWSAHPAYAIQNSQLVNVNGQDWGQLAVFKLVKNPIEASIEFAKEPNADAVGIDKAGVAILLDNSTYNANGYLCTIRNQAGKDPVLYLFTIVNGKATDVITTHKLTGFAKPIPGDILKIIVISDDTGHYFEYFLNDIYYGRLSDPQKRYSNGTNYYAGVQLFGGLKNNLETFKVLNEAGEPKLMEKVKPLTNVSGLAGHLLPDSLVIRARDENSNPVSNLIVDFNVTKGGGKLDIEPPDDNIRREAENANALIATFKVKSDTSASGDNYVYTEGGEAFNGKLEFNIYIENPGDYIMFGRIMVPDKELYNYFVQIDGEPKLDTLNLSNPTGVWDLQKEQNTWFWNINWERGKDTYKVWNLTKGIHKVRITQRWCPNVKLDKIILSQDLTFWPKGKEEYPEYITDAYGLARAALTLGPNPGINEVQVTAPGYTLQGAPVIFSVTGLADAVASMAASSPTSQSGVAGKKLSNPFEVKLTMQSGNPGTGQAVTFNVTKGGGLLSNGQSSENVITDVNGKASTYLTLGTEVAENEVRATYPGLSDVVFKATATSGLADRLEKVTTQNLSGLVNTDVPTPLKVRVLDNTNKAVPNHNVQFQLTSGDGSLISDTGLTTEKTIRTDIEGYAEISLHLGKTAGNNIVSVSAQKAGTPLSGSPIQFTAIGTPDSPDTLVEVSGNGQTGAIGMLLNKPFIIKITDKYGNGIVGHRVQFTITKGNGSLTPTGPWFTEANGIAQVTLTLGTEPGMLNEVQVTAEHEGKQLSAPIVFKATAGIVSAIERIGNQNLKGSAGLPIEDSLKVKILDNYGNPVGGYDVTWMCVGNNIGTVNGEVQSIVPTDNKGISKARFVCGSKPGLASEAVARADGLNGSPIQFTIDVANIDALQKASSYTYSGIVGTPLSQPFQVRVLDDLSHAIPNYKVTFAVKQGDGNFNGKSSIDVYTNSDKIAEASLTLGPKPGNDNNVVEVSAFRKGKEILTNGSLDEWGSNYPVGWYISVGQGSAYFQEVTNAKSGKCIKIIVGPTGEVVTIYGSSNITVSENTEYEVSFWVKGAVGGETIRARLVDSNGYYLNPDGTWSSSYKEYLNVNTTTTSYQKYSMRFTTRSGVTALEGAQFRILASKANEIFYVDDISLNEVKAEGERHLNGSPKLFTASAVIGAADKLVYMDGDSQYVVVGNRLENPLVVQVTDKSGNPIVNHNVTFEVKAGGGYLDSDSTLKVITKTTNDSGKTQVELTVGIKSGEYNNIVEVRAERTAGGNLTNSPLRFYISARPSAADKLIKISGDRQANSPVRQKLTQPFVVKIIDKQGVNGIANHPVTFTMIAGNGNFDEVNGPQKKTVYSLSDGTASVYYIPGPKSGEENVVEATSKNGAPDLNGSPAKFYVTPITGAISPSVSKIEATGPVPANGESKSNITITLTDDYGNPISNKAVTISVSGSRNFIDQPQALTDNNGRVAGAVASTKAELKTVNARDVSDGVNLTSSAKVRFTNLEAQNISYNSGNNQQGNFFTALKEPIKAQVTDKFGNAVYYHPVFFEAYQGGGLIYNLNKQRVHENEQVFTDSTGVASVYWVLGPSEIVNRARATSPNLSGTAEYIATGNQGTATQLNKVSGDRQDGTAGYTLLNPLIVKVIDENSNPIYNYPVRYDVSLGGGSFNNKSSITLATDHFGEAVVYFTIGREAGINQAKATAQNLSGSPQYFTAQGSSGMAAKIVKVSGDGSSGSVGGTLSGITVVVTDLYDNVFRGGHKVYFSIVAGNATILDSQPVTSGIDGRASTSIRFGTKTGEVVVQASAFGLINDPLKFKVNARAATAVKMSIYQGDDQNGTIGRELVYPLKVLVVDTYNNPARNVSISFVTSGGNGSLLTPQLIYTDDDGIAAARLKLGSETGAYQVMAVNNSLAGNPLYFDAAAVTNNFPEFVNLSDEITSPETQTIGFTVQANDADLDPLSYQATNLPPGATFDPLTRRFSWTPNFLQAGEYEVHFIARDNQGGLDDETVKMIITNLNRPPQVINYEPKQSYIVGHKEVGETFNFSIDITDQDTDDEIKYQWYYNDILVATTSRYSLYIGNEFVNLGMHTIRITATDSYDKVERAWEVAVKVPVELVSFSAEVRPREGVYLNWNTNYELNNAGFNLLRSNSINGAYKSINEKLIPAAENKEYRFHDSSVKVGETYYYKLEDVSINGNKTEHEAIKIYIAKPETYELSQNYPNPFNPSTAINFQLPEQSRVTLRIYNLLGQEIITLINDKKEAGYYTVIWNGLDMDGNQVASGIYYYRIVAGSFVQSKKMILIK